MSREPDYIGLGVGFLVWIGSIHGGAQGSGCTLRSLKSCCLGQELSILGGCVGQLLIRPQI